MKTKQSSIVVKYSSSVATVVEHFCGLRMDILVYHTVHVTQPWLRKMGRPM